MQLITGYLDKNALEPVLIKEIESALRKRDDTKRAK